MQPLRFTPLLKRIRWGGRRLGTVLGKEIGPETDYAESWELSDHGSDQTVVAEGTYAGWSLQKLLQERSEAVFGPRQFRDQFPLLIKFLDCHDRLSVQVHPNDEQAKQFAPPSNANVRSNANGKSEAWVVLKTEPDSFLYAGLKPGVTAAQLRSAIEQQTIEELLHKIVPQPGACFYIPAGTVHAVGNGVLLTEIQQSSNLTFRLHDWNRLDHDGNPRPLHIEESLQCIDFARGPIQAAIPTIISSEGENQLEQLVECPYFSLFRLTIPQKNILKSASLCRILIGLSGTGILKSAGKSQTLSQGQTLLVPATAPDQSLKTEGSEPWQFLIVEVPA